MRIINNDYSNTSALSASELQFQQLSFWIYKRDIQVIFKETDCMESI